MHSLFQFHLNGFVQKLGPAIDASHFGDGHFPVAPAQYAYDCSNELRKRSCRFRENLTSHYVASVSELRDERKCFWENVIRTLGGLIEQAIPIPRLMPVENIVGQFCFRSTIFLSAKRSSDCASPDVERASLVAKPWAASTGAGCFSIHIAPKCCGACARQQDDALTRPKCSFQRDFEIGCHVNQRVGISAFEKRRDGSFRSSGTSPAQPGTDASNIPGAYLLLRKDAVGRFSQRKPCS